MPQWYDQLEAWCFGHRIWATAPVMLLLLLLAHPSSNSLCLGGIIVILGEAGRAWASGYIEKNACLATAGPYRFTRNPLYFFNSIIFLGFCLMANNPWAAVFGLLAFTIIYRPALRNEAAYMHRLFGEEFERWASVVPLFLPRWTNYPSQGHYQCHLLLQHREHKNSLAMLAGIAVFVAIWYLQQR
ncbi:MAG: isoprenylcysteine carboxylmethyltransferase family protein [Mariprofundaceae bacterium]|nr:isoprenylcysteine carboxylmethyltransferase family protein [Mariprofundaceae bacterium]